MENIFNDHCAYGSTGWILIKQGGYNERSDWNTNSLQIKQATSRKKKLILQTDHSNVFAILPARNYFKNMMYL